MTRGKVKLELIANESERKTSFRKRKKGLINKARELCTLCDVQGCAIIYSPFEQEPVVWPSQMEAQEVISRFQNVPEIERNRRMFNQESYVEQRIHKSQEHSQRLVREIQAKDTEILLHRVMAGFEDINQLPLDTVAEIGRMAAEKMQEFAAQIAALQITDPAEQNFNNPRFGAPPSFGRGEGPSFAGGPPPLPGIFPGIGVGGPPSFGGGGGPSSFGGGEGPSYAGGPPPLPGNFPGTGGGGPPSFGGGGGPSFAGGPPLLPEIFQGAGTSTDLPGGSDAPGASGSNFWN